MCGDMCGPHRMPNSDRKEGVKETKIRVCMCLCTYKEGRDGFGAFGECD